jgi:CMP-N,N'-diacetyllegionaminic acid synthase
MRVLGLIPARGGSKGVRRKNVKLLAGRPLLQYTVEAARAATRLTRVVLSTDDEEIAELGRRLGVDVPFLRPAELARDDTPMIPVVQNALRALEEVGDRYDAVCLLQPTTPLRPPSLIDKCVEMLERTGADSVISLRPVPTEFNPHWVFVSGGDGMVRLFTGEEKPLPRRQELPPAYYRDGAVYVARRALVLEGGTLYGPRTAGYLVDGTAPTVNIDEPADWARAEALVRAAGPEL